MNNEITAKDGRKFRFRVLINEDRAQVLQLILTNFVAGEPLNQSQNLKPGDSGDEVFLHTLNNTLPSNASLGVYEHDPQKLIGVILCLFSTSTNKPLDLNILSNKVAKIHRFLNKIESCIPNTIIGNHKFMFINVSTIESKFARLGIMGELRKRLFEISRQNDCKFLVSTSTSKFTQKINEKQGFVTVKSVRYDEYVDDVTGEKEFLKVPPPHESAKIMCLTL